MNDTKELPLNNKKYIFVVDLVRDCSLYTWSKITFCARSICFLDYYYYCCFEWETIQRLDEHL